MMYIEHHTRCGANPIGGPMSRSKKEEENKGEQLVRVLSRDGQKIAKDYNCIEILH
jgi:hypothetical protein